MFGNLKRSLVVYLQPQHSLFICTDFPAYCGRLLQFKFPMALGCRLGFLQECPCLHGHIFWVTFPLFFFVILLITKGKEDLKRKKNHLFLCFALFFLAHLFVCCFEDWKNYCVVLRSIGTREKKNFILFLDFVFLIAVAISFLSH